MSQAKYLKDILEKFGMSDASPCKTPMPTKITLTEDTNGIPFDPSKYRSMIGSLLYLCASRPDIMFSVCMCARFQASLWKVIIRRLSIFLDTLFTPQSWASSTPMILSLISLGTRMRIGLERKWIISPPPVHVSFLDTPW